MHGATYSQQSTAMGNDQGGMFRHGIAENTGPLGLIRKLSCRHSQATHKDPPVTKILVSLSVPLGTQPSYLGKYLIYCVVWQPALMDSVLDWKRYLVLALK